MRWEETTETRPAPETPAAKDDDKIKPGDVVRLKSGGTTMTVEELSEDGTEADCLWMTAGTLDRATINVIALQKD